MLRWNYSIELRFSHAMAGLLGLLCLVLSACTYEGKASPAERELVVFAAASLRDAVQDLGGLYAAEHGLPVVYNFAGSNTLARQIVASPKADVFLSASEQWMDHVQRAGRLQPRSRVSILSNRLVVICQAGCDVSWSAPEQLCALEFKHFSLADPAAVPAGKYAKEWLESVDCGGRSLWNVVSKRVVPAPDVRAALALVEATPEIVGLVYKTDAVGSQRVRILHEVPAAHSPRISYSIALLKGRRDPARGRAFLELARSPVGHAVFTKYGFIPNLNLPK